MTQFILHLHQGSQNTWYFRLENQHDVIWLPLSAKVVWEVAALFSADGEPVIHGNKASDGREPLPQNGSVRQGQSQSPCQVLAVEEPFWFSFSRWLFWELFVVNEKRNVQELRSCRFTAGLNLWLVVHDGFCAGVCGLQLHHHPVPHQHLQPPPPLSAVRTSGAGQSVPFPRWAFRAKQNAPYFTRSAVLCSVHV